jgi:ApbE superfamily uncharacterized protein (UPF0280 family)
MGIDNPAFSFTLDYGETHLTVSCDLDLRSEALDELIGQYTLLVAYMNENPLFKASYQPIDVKDDSPVMVKGMAAAARVCGVGPMAAVAGAIAGKVGERLASEGASDFTIENGGDIYLKASCDKTVGLYAGKSPFSGRFAFIVKPEDTPCGICTSSASVGHSISLGEADAVTVVADSPGLADAAATAIANATKGEGGVKMAVEKAKTVTGIRGVLAVRGDSMGAWGRLPQLVKG